MSQVFKFIDSKSTHKNLYILRKNLFFNLKNKLRSQAYNVLINQLSATWLCVKCFACVNYMQKSIFTVWCVITCHRRSRHVMKIGISSRSSY